MRRFENETVLVTGAGGGMGVSHVRAFHAEGAAVVIGDRNVERGARLAAELGERALVVPLDVTDEEQWAAAVASAEERFGPVSVLVNNAGVPQAAATVEQTGVAAWRRLMDINVTGQFLGIRAVTPSMRRGGGGAIVNIASSMGNTATPYFAAYTTSKWALRGLTRTAALELGRDGIRVNSIHPGAVSTPFITEPAAPGLDPITDSYSPEPFAIPRVGQPEDVTRLVLFVASDDASYATGSEFVLDGGLLLGPALKHEPEAP
ncbi:3alpha(or 20beta)-hydroxysteroid dehydrogenase [Promicromonospora sp. AC04]|uniref:SDR family NAD(P)-dependent oxidoreductase n=1 Tax=Promicromonospora sp. AC04 TaxID=2135723 RepID=UPI000D3330EA|nr:glucose 1-dehydrogenase [Promicromonospora sp. AC04]PUB26285.1 3alpha(or 20beta)-hydroxysteroid dehydrogenase [Promicromonospora sp. AC04]